MIWPQSLVRHLFSFFWAVKWNLSHNSFENTPKCTLVFFGEAELKNQYISGLFPYPKTLFHSQNEKIPKYFFILWDAIRKYSFAIANNICLNNRKRIKCVRSKFAERKPHAPIVTSGKTLTLPSTSFWPAYNSIISLS